MEQAELENDGANSTIACKTTGPGENRLRF